MWLVIDTAGPFCGAGLFDDDHEIAVYREEIGRGHAERLMPMIEKVLTRADATWRDVSTIAVARGPGSFTGLRVGLAAARGLGLALGIPVQGVSVLDALARDFVSSETEPCEPFVVVLDARRGEVWCAAFDGAANPLGDPWSTAAGSFVPPEGVVRVHRVCIASATLPALHCVARAHSASTAPPTGLYLRPADAKPQAASLS